MMPAGMLGWLHRTTWPRMAEVKIQSRSSHALEASRHPDFTVFQAKDGLFPGRDSSSTTRMTLWPCPWTRIPGPRRCLFAGTPNASSRGWTPFGGSASPFPVRGVSHHTSRTFFLGVGERGTAPLTPQRHPDRPTMGVGRDERLPQVCAPVGDRPPPRFSANQLPRGGFSRRPSDSRRRSGPLPRDDEPRRPAGS